MLKAIIAAYKKHSIYRTTFNELSRLSDKELYDLGIDRSEIESVARGYTHETPETKKPDFYTKIFKANTEKARVDEYLADSADLVDLENRIKNIDRGLAPWQLRNKTYLQGWAS
jgi:uncharacterized protein YjiS (DUF1127 family)